MILSKVSCFDVKASWWDCFKGVSSLYHLCIAKNTDYLLNDITGLVGILLLPETDDSTDNGFNESYEDEDSDKIKIVFCAIQTRSSSG